MANLTLRLVKGSPLTYTEVDDNFTALNDATGHFKNAIINGNFDIWQRGMSFTIGSSTIYTADRMLTSAGSGGVGTVSRQTFTLGQTDVPGNPKYFYRHARTTAGSSDNAVVGQNIESVAKFSGQTITVSIWGKVSSGTKALVPRLVQVFGTGGSPSSDVVTSLSSITLTTSWQKFDMEFSVPSITGKTLGSDGNDYLRVDLLENSSFGTFTADFSQFQVEKGDEPTEFERRPLQTELALCNRYFIKSMNGTPAHGVSGGSGAGAVALGINGRPLYSHVHFPVEMRATPTITFYGYAGASSAVWRNVDNSADGPSANSLNTGRMSFIAISSANVTSDIHFIVHYTADAEF